MNKPLQLTLSLTIASHVRLCRFGLPGLEGVTPVDACPGHDPVHRHAIAGTLNSIKARGAALYRKFKHFDKLQVLHDDCRQGERHRAQDRTSGTSHWTGRCRSALDLTAATVGASLAFQSGFTGEGRRRGGRRQRHRQDQCRSRTEPRRLQRGLRGQPGRRTRTGTARTSPASSAATGRTPAANSAASLPA